MAAGPAPTAGPAGNAQFRSKVVLSVSCNNLMDMDVFSKSDPLCVIHMTSSESQWYEVSVEEKRPGHG